MIEHKLLGDPNVPFEDLANKKEVEGTISKIYIGFNRVLDELGIKNLRVEEFHLGPAEGSPTAEITLCFKCKKWKCKWVPCE